MSPHDDLAGVAAEADWLSKEMQPMLKGRGPLVQTAVLADLVSIWLAGNWPEEAREALLQEFVILVRKLAPVNEHLIFGPEGHPGRRAQH